MDRGSQEGLGFSAEAGSPQRVLYSRTCSDSLSEGPHTVGHEWTQAPGSCLEPVLAGGQSGEVAARHPAAKDFLWKAIGTHMAEGVRELSGVSSVRVLISFMRVPIAFQRLSLMEKVPFIMLVREISCLLLNML